MNRKSFVSFLLLGLAFFASGLTVGCGYRNTRDFSKSKAVELITEVELYKARNHKLPRGLEDLQQPALSVAPVYYHMQTRDSYIVWYGAELGESETYDSRKKQWTREIIVQKTYPETQSFSIEYHAHDPEKHIGTQQR
jgi:predicted nucleotidyltransferase